MFGAFIIACGTGHILDIWTLWYPTYWLSGLVKAFTATVSVLTAIELIFLIPHALAVPSSAQLEAANQELAETLRKLQQTQTQLIQTEKMSSLGQLVAGIAHEINNPVNFIHGNLLHTKEYTQELLRLLEQYQSTYPTPPEPLRNEVDTCDLEFIQTDLPKMLASMQVGTERIRQLVLSLRNFSRLDESETKPANIHDGINSTLLILQYRLKPKPEQPILHIEQDYADIPEIECYPGQLNQVFMNVISNAIDALEGSMKFKANSTNSQTGSPSPTIRIQTQLFEKNWVLISITDNGPGIPESVQQRIFDPFFTTKPVGKGTGLGLSISYQIIVEKHQGQFTCVSKLGQGTTFQIKIPVHPVKQVTKSLGATSTLHENYLAPAMGQA